MVWDVRLFCVGRLLSFAMRVRACPNTSTQQLGCGFVRRQDLPGRRSPAASDTILASSLGNRACRCGCDRKADCRCRTEARRRIAVADTHDTRNSCAASLIQRRRGIDWCSAHRFCDVVHVLAAFIRALAECSHGFAAGLAMWSNIGTVCRAIAKVNVNLSVVALVAVCWVRHLSLPWFDPLIMHFIRAGAIGLVSRFCDANRHLDNLDTIVGNPKGR